MAPEQDKKDVKKNAANAQPTDIKNQPAGSEESGSAGFERPNLSIQKPLEVETPEESQISHDIGDKISEVVEPETEETSEDFFDSGEGGFFSQLRRILGMAGITKKTVFGCLFLLLIGGGAVLFFTSGGLSGIREWISKLPFGQEEGADEGDRREEEKALEKPSFFSPMHIGLQTAFFVGDQHGIRSKIFSPALQNAFTFGQLKVQPEISSDTQGVLNIAYFYGYRGSPTDRLAQYIFVLGSIQNSLNTDVFALLDATFQRSAALEHHIQELTQLLETSRQMSSFVSQEIAAFQLQMSHLRSLKSEAEKQFFVSVGNFQGESSRASLDGFIQHSQGMVSGKAHFLALKKVAAIYDTAIKKLDARIRDLSLNREALIKGVQVVDVQNSNLNLILTETQALE